MIRDEDNANCFIWTFCFLMAWVCTFRVYFLPPSPNEHKYNTDIFLGENLLRVYDVILFIRADGGI